MKDDPLKGINVDAAGGASKVLRMLAAKVRQSVSGQTQSPAMRRLLYVADDELTYCSQKQSRCHHHKQR